ncbi:nuclear transport factor 2 family protein [Nocardia sp. CC227C]|uniref:nuclear transport factor 2 family protein n=1 Tax=Nocardia sp. CC227C TaxID=3044562 RepID=UPI00278C5124|nr:nuclear transport factor 2 family protein [Nocardia sp. CC227C]
MTAPPNMSEPQRITEIVERWRRAELAGDPDSLDALLADDFLGVGPMGWVRTKAQWLDKYRTGAVRNDAFELSDLHIRPLGSAALVVPLGSAALVVAHQSQRGVNGAADTSGEFRFSLTVAGERIGSIHVTRIIPPR